ncbi:MAG TPA: cytochrome c oxidase subunit 3 [Candidatus Acidoferrales bacterium]|jgi:cytochrome c oxidase subunit 3|nr:cytochrome c oxidase subunit 3 [Candidatus Acidoferrales bacterium]
MTAEAPALTAHAEGHESAAAHARRGISNPILGMLLFITSEVMFFSGLFAAYFSTRAQDKGSVPWDQWQGLLNPLSLILLATVILITSSFTCQFAVWAIQRGDRKGFIRNIAITFVLGITFLLMQAYDYSLLFGDGLTMASSMFGTTYFTLTGFHGAHVFGGVLMLGVILYRGMAGQFSAKHHDAVEAVSFYWHFVDVVWIILFSVLYLL